MYEITINHRDGAKTYPVYTEKEAKVEGIDYTHWKEAVKGKWAVSDDGHVSKVITVRTYPSDRDCTTTYIKMPWGYVMHNTRYKNQKFLAAGRSTPHTFSGKSQLMVRAGQDKMKNLAMAEALTMNKDLAIDLAIGSTTPPQRRKWKRHMKSEVFRNMVRNELQNLLSDHGMTEDYTLELLEETIGLAKDKKDVTNLMRAVENLQGMHGMKEKDKVKTTHQLEGTVTRKLLDQMAEEERKLISKHIVEKDEGLRESVRKEADTKEVS